MQIDRIKITNFKSIPELDLNFHEMTGLWEISGVVGAGKTTIGEAILFALFGAVRGKNNDELIMWGRKHSLIEAWVYSKARHIHIRREINSYGQSPLLVDVDGTEVLGSDKRSIQNILETEWYDISRQTLELLCIISFNNFKSLSTLNTADSREFLNSTLAFDKIDLYENYCKDRIKECEDNIRTIESKRLRAEGALKGLSESVPIVPKYTSLDEIKKLETEALEKYNTTNTEYQKTHDILYKEYSEQGSKQKTAQAALKSIENQFKKLASGICPVCGQPITPEHRTEMEQEINTVKQEVDKCDKIVGEINERLQQFEIIGRKKLDELRNEHQTYKWEHAQTESYKKHLDNIEKKQEQYRMDIKKYEEEMEKCNEVMNDWKEMFDFIREKVRPTIISSIIPNINKYIEYYMVRAHQNYVVFFDENFKCMMKNPFNEFIPVSSLSTGQKKTIDMIIILAFIKTFITQIDFNVYFMDELIGNIDANLRDEMCGLLRGTLDEKDVMFLISHSPINQEYLDGIIKVSRSAGISEYSIVNVSK